MHRACRQLSAQGMQPDLEAAQASALLTLSAEAHLSPAFRSQTQRELLMSVSFGKSTSVGSTASAASLGSGDKWDLLVWVSAISNHDRDRKERRQNLCQDECRRERLLRVLWVSQVTF